MVYLCANLEIVDNSDRLLILENTGPLKSIFLILIRNKLHFHNGQSVSIFAMDKIEVTWQCFKSKSWSINFRNIFTVDDLNSSQWA